MDSFVDSRVVPIRVRKPTTAIQVGDAIAVKPELATTSLSLTKDGIDGAVETWSSDAHLYRAFAEIFKAEFSTDGTPIPVVQGFGVTVFDGCFVHVMTKIGWEVDLLAAGEPMLERLSRAIQRVARAVASGIVSKENGVVEQNYGFSSVGFDAENRCRTYFRRYNTIYLGRKISGLTPVHLEGVTINLGWHYSSVELDASTSLRDANLQKVLRLDGCGLCYSAAVHGATLRAHHALRAVTAPGADAQTSAEMRQFLGELAVSVSCAEMVLSWADNTNKHYIDEYARVNDFARRYRLTMDLERAIARDAERLAADEDERRARWIETIMLVIAVATIGSVIKDVGDIEIAKAATLRVIALLAAIMGVVGAASMRREWLWSWCKRAVRGVKRWVRPPSP